MSCSCLEEPLLGRGSPHISFSGRYFDRACVIGWIIFVDRPPNLDNPGGRVVRYRSVDQAVEQYSSVAGYPANRCRM